MLYRTNPKNDDKLSALGFGCMHFPTKRGMIDEEEAKKLLLYAVDNGVNYFDTAYIYHMGKSEGFLGNVLSSEGIRSRVKIATKLPQFLVKKKEDFDKFFNNQLTRLKTDYIDYYLIHMLGDLNTFKKLTDLGITEWIKNKKETGAVKNIGFSFHGKANEFIDLIDAYDWDFCQIQYNYLDTNNQAGTKGLEYAAKKGLPVIIMEPLRGGKLVSNLPPDASELIDGFKIKRSPADWAFRWILNHPEVTVVLSGMSSFSQLEENIKTMSETKAESLSKEELGLIDNIKDIINRDIRVPCTGCAYCMPCPYGVDIPACFASLNDKYTLKSGHPMLSYMRNTGAYTSYPAYASVCKSCGACLKNCPQSIDIPEKLKEVSKEFEGFRFKVMVKAAGAIMGNRIKNGKKEKEKK